MADAFKIVPICFLMQDYDSAVEVGRALEEVLDATNTVVIASSDMTHYEPAKRQLQKTKLHSKPSQIWMQNASMKQLNHKTSRHAVTRQ